VNEYMYCATPDRDSNLTVTRLEKLVAGYLEQSLKPDKVKSEKVPDAKKNRGPVYKVVSDNLMETVLDAERDVVLHVYSKTDEKWEDTAFEMEKYAEAVEDITTIKVCLSSFYLVAQIINDGESRYRTRHPLTRTRTPAHLHSDTRTPALRHPHLTGGGHGGADE
jgi:hypothetical protein